MHRVINHYEVCTSHFNSIHKSKPHVQKLNYYTATTCPQLRTLPYYIKILENKYAAHELQQNRLPK